MALLAVRREPTVFVANAVRIGRVAVSGRDGAPVVPDRPLSRLAPAATFVEGRAGWERGMAGKKAEDARAKVGAGDAAKLIDAKIAALGGWRGEMLARLRELIRAADPGVVEEVKWRKPSNPAGVPVWSHAGILCTGETYRDKVKLTFAKGALLDDPSCLFNASLDGNIRRAIDIGEGATIDETALTALIHAAVALNTARR